MTKPTLAIVRAMAVVGVTVGLVVGLTLSLPSASASLLGNTFATATPGLQISTDNTTFANTQTGFTLTKVVPNIETDASLFQLKNSGDVPLNLSVAVAVLPDVTNGAGGFLAGVEVNIYDIDNGGTQVVHTNLQQLFDTPPVFSANNPIPSGITRHYRLAVKVNASVIATGSASVTPFNIVFTGTQPN